MTVRAEQNAASKTPSPALSSTRHFWLFATLLAVGPLPMLVKLGRFLADREQYQFFPFMIAAAVLLAWERWRDLPDKQQLRPGTNGIGIVLLLVGMLMLATSALVWVQVLSGFAMLFIIAAIGWKLGGPRLLRMLAPSLILLLMILPPPGRWDLTITQNLQQVAVGLSSRMLDLLQIPHVKSGNILEIPQRRLLVEQACSGINSLMAVLAFTLFFGFWKQRSWWRILLLLPVAAMFVVWGNVARITGEAWLMVARHVDLLDGLGHQAMGLVLFIGCVGLTLSFDALLGLLVGLRDRDARDAVVPGPGKSMGQAAPLRITLPEWCMAFGFFALGIWIQARVWNAWTPPSVQAHAQFDLPATLGGWQRMNRAPLTIERPQTQAAISFVWQYHQNNLVASIAIDYPFVGYHELTTCYGTTGWKMGPEITTIGDDEAFQQTDMTRIPDQFAELLFNLSDERGRPVKPEPGYSGSIRDKLNFHRHDALAGATYQVQVVAQQFEPLSPAQQNQTRELFLAAQRSLIAQLLAQLEKR